MDTQRQGKQKAALEERRWESGKGWRRGGVTGWEGVKIGQKRRRPSRKGHSEAKGSGVEVGQGQSLGKPEQLRK